MPQATIDETERHAGEGEVARTALDAILALTPDEALAMPEVRARLDARDDGADDAHAEGVRSERIETPAWLSREVRRAAFEANNEHDPRRAKVISN